MSRATTTTALVDVDPAALAAAIGVEPLRVVHRLADDARLAADALAERADALPAEWTRIARGDVPPLSLRRPVHGTDVGATIASLAEATTTVRLYHLELVPDYRGLGDDALSSVDAALARASAQPTGRSTAVFFGSPGAVVPAHIDRYHNLLLQVRGTKRVDIGWFTDPERQQAEVERDFDGTARGPSELPPVQFSAELGPGDGVYIPPYAFHWTRSGEGVSVALSVGWRTPAADRIARAHECNMRMRARKLSPRPVGSSPARDRLKSTATTVARRLRG